MSNSISEISVVEPSDYPNLARFLSEFPYDKLSKDQWLLRLYYWWDDNPAFSVDWIRGFKLVAAGTIVGFVGSYPTFMMIGDKVSTVFNGTTWRVKEGFRNESIDLWSYNRRVSKNYISFNSTATTQVVKLILKYNYKLYPWGDNRQYYYLMNSANYLKVRFPKFPCFVCRFAGRFISWAQSLRIRLSHTDILSKACKEPDSRYDELWANNSKQYDFTNVRDSQSVSWYAKGKILISLLKDEKLVGYAILYPSTYSNKELKELVLVDFFVDVSISVAEAISSLLRYIGRNHLMQGYSVIKFPCFSVQLQSALAGFGLYSKEIELNGYVRIPKDMPQLYTFTNPYLVNLQGDWGSFGLSEIS